MNKHSILPISPVKLDPFYTPASYTHTHAFTNYLKLSPLFKSAENVESMIIIIKLLINKYKLIEPKI